MAGSNMVEHKLRLLIETELDEKQKQQVGKQLKTILEGAAIGFDEAETKKNLIPIIRMIQKLFDKAEMKFDADKLLGMPSQKALQSIADITAEEFQTAFDRALAKSGGIKIDFGNIDLSGMTEPLERVAGELAEISQKIANDTKKSVDDIEASIKRLNKVKPKTITTKVVEDGVEKKVTKEVSRVEQTIETIEKTLDAANNPKSLNTEKAAVKALEKAKDKYTESVSKGDPWEIQYQYLVSFVSKYESMTKKIKPIMDANHAEFKELYDVLSPKAGAAKISLEHFVDVSRGNELSEYKNQPWARESTLKKIEQTLKGGISVKDGGDKEDPGQKEQPKPTTGPKPVSGDDNNGKKLNTKVDPASPKKKVDAAKEVLDLTQQTRVEEEKVTEAAVKAAESVSDAITEPVLTELQKRIVAAVEEAKSKSIRDWETGTPNSERNRIMAEAIKSNFIFSEDANDDDIDDIINNAVSFSVGDMEADEIEDVFKPFIVSLDDAYNQASSEAKELVKQLAGIKDQNSNEALDILDQIADIDEQLNGIINHVIESYMGPWDKFRDKILGNTTGATSSSTKTAGSSRDNIQTILDDANKFLSSNTDKKIEDYFELIATGAIEMSNDVKSAIEATIGSIDSLQYVNAGANNRGGLIGDKSALILKKPHWNANDKKWAVDKQQNDDAIELQNRLSGADVSDVNLGKIQEVINAEEYLVELQSRVSGAPISTIGEAIAGINPDILNVTEASVRNLISAMRELYNMGVETDVENLGNILYDGQGDQFGIVDMDVKHDFESFEDMLAAFAQTVRSHVEDVATILNDPKMVQAWTRFADMVDGAVGNISTHQTETEIEGVRQQNEALKENIKLKEQSAETQESMYSAEESTVDNDDLGKQVEVKATIESDELRSILEGITYNVKVAQDAERTNDSKVSIDAEELKRTLKAITYNVKVAHEADVADSKVSIDEAALEGVLNKVFANILNPGDEVKVDTAALADAISKIQITPDNEGLIAEIKALMPTLGGLAQENTLQAIKILLEQKDAPTAQKMPPEVKLETSSKRDDRFERLADVASMYEDVEDVESAIKEFGSVYKEIVLISDEATKVIKANKTGINTLRKIANETLDTSDYSWVEFKRNEQYAPVAEKQGAGTVSIDEGALKQLLNSIVYNVKIAHDDADKTANKIAIDETGLRNVLQDIVYNVKIAHDDSDKNANKIGIDESALENVLNRVFAGILNSGNSSVDMSKILSVLQNASKAKNNVDINPHYLTDPQGNTVEMYRGIHGAYGGLVSDRYHGGTFFTDNIELAKEYAGELGKVEKVLLSMKNPLEIDGHGAQWNDIEYIGRGIDDASRRLHELHNEMKAFVEYVDDVGDIVLQNAFTGEVISRNFEPESGHEYETERFNYLNREIQAIYTDSTNPYGVYDTNQLAEFAQNNGYDGVIFKNIIDSFSGDVQKISNVMVTFAQDQIHYIETMNTGSAEWKNVLSKAGDFNKYINMTTDDVESFVMQLSTMREHFLDEAFTGSENPEDVYSRLKGEFIDPDPAFRSLYDAMFSLDDLPDDYLKVPGFIGHPSFDENGMFVDASNFITDVREALQKEQGVDGSDSTGKSFALDSTLQTVKGVLDDIRNNTAKFGTIEISNVDAIAGTTLEGKLTEIKSVLESIDNKIAKGGVIATRGAVKQANAQSVEQTVKEQAARSNMLKSIVNDYKTMGKLAAQFANDGDLKTKAMLDNLKEEINRKRRSLKLTMDENKSLREKYSIAFDAEKRLLEAEKAQSEINAKNKADAKDAEVAWKKQVKDAQRATGINAATSIANSGDQTVLRTIGAKDVSDDISQKAKELSDQIKALRAVRDEIDKKGDQASEEDRNNLSKQIASVKTLKSELDGYLKIHEKYSGDDATDLGDASNFGAVGTNEYWNNITAAVKAQAEGRVAIKGLNADTGELTGTTKIAANTFATWSATVDPLTGRLSMLRTGIKKTETLVESITRKTKEVFTYFSGSSVVFKFFNEIKRGIQYVKEIDLALTELKKVTDETEESYDRFLETASKTAAKVGSTIKDVVSSTADWARLGYSMEQAAKFAESTQILMNVSEFTDVSQATDTLISAVQAFGYTADTSMEVVDLLNTIGNNYAISTADLAQSLTKSSASLVAAGGDLAEAAALTATANAIIQDADSVGTALKTTSLRLRGTDVKVLEEEGLDSEGAVTSKSKLQSKVKALSGVDILTATGEYKSTYEILSDIAEVWESINDMDQAALLELISGKRNSSVIAAILQNPEELKAAFEDANNASGSALKENEKYLDSIQGKIDQFNNAMQSMWSNLLNSDIVKAVVEWGTKIIKSLDTAEGKILAIVKAIAILMAYKKANPLDWIQNIGDFFATVKSNGIKQYLMSLLGLAPAMKTVTAETVANTIATEVNDAAKTKAILTSAGLTGATGTLSIAQRKQAADSILAAVNAGTLSVAQGQAALTTLGFATAVNTADGSLKILDVTTKSFMATNPIGWILAIVSVLMTVIMLLSQIPSGMEKLSGEISDLKSEIADLGSEIDSINSELKTTQDRIAELLALPSLSFVEQEELNKLIAYNDQLERNKKIKEDQQKTKERIQIKKTDKYINDYWNSKSVDKKYAIGENGVIVKDTFWDAGQNTKLALDNALRNYEKYTKAKDIGEQLLAGWDDYSDYEKYMLSGKTMTNFKFKGVSEEEFNRDPKGYLIDSKDTIAERIRNYDEILGEISNSIDMVFADENLEDLSYGMSDTINDYLDEQYAYQLKRKKIDGEHVIGDAISSMFDTTASKEMQKLGKELQSIMDDDSIVDKNQAILDKINGLDGAADASLEVDKLSDSYNRLKTTMDIVGITAQDISDYFVLESEAYDSNTPEGIMNQYKTVKTALENLKSGAISLDDLVKYDAESGEATGRVDAIAEQLKGVSPEVRKQFTSVVEAIKEGAYDTENGLINWDAAIKKLELQGMQSVISLAEEELTAANKIAFPDLEISSWIDSVDELKGAFDSLSGAMDLIVTANEQMASSGRISMKTALDLMATTDEWNKILDVNNGVITMNANAEQILIQSKLDLIKANIEMALQQVETDIALMEGAINSTKAGDAFTQGFTKALTNAQGVLVGLKAGWDAFWAGEDVSSAFNSAYSSTVNNLTPDESSLSELYAQKDNLLKQREMLNSVDTTKEFKDNYDFDKNPGDKYDESAEDAFQKEMDYWENRIGANQAKYEQIQNEIDLLESKGQKANTAYYQEQISLENQRMHLLQGQKRAAKEYLATLDEGSAEWWEVANTLNDIEGEIDSVTASIVDLQDAIDEINVYKFDEFNTRLDDITSKLGTIRDLIAPNSEEDWFDDEGGWTESGVAVLGSYLQELETYKQGYQNTVEEMAKYAEEYEGNEGWYNSLGIHSEQEYYDKVESLMDQQYDYAQSISDTEQSVVDMYESNIDAVEEYTETLIDSYNDYIDSVKEALDAERDLYDFKKNVQKQSKDIADIERRIASLSGSTNKADIAERRKLEAQLYESRESLDDTYYDHAKNAQSEALDVEAEAYETSMNNMIDGLRVSLEEATLNMDEFLMGVTSMVMYNADTVLAKYEETNLPLTAELTNPWIKAKEAVGDYSGNALDLMNQWTKEGGFFAQFNATGTVNLQSPWNSGTLAATAFKTSVSNVMSSVVSNISSNVRSASGELSRLYQQIKDTEARAASANVAVSSGGSGSGGGSGGGTAGSSQSTPSTAARVDDRILNKYKLTSSQVLALGYGPITLEEFERLLRNYQIKYSATYKQVANTQAIERSLKKVISGQYVTGPLAVRKYAKGTIGTNRDEWAITDEFGPELTMYATPEGTLSFMRAGSTVVPAEITKNLVEWGQFTPDAMNLGGGVNVNMINNAVNKPEFNFVFDALVKAERIDENTLPEVKKFVQQEINSLVKQMNYAIKGKGGR